MEFTKLLLHFENMEKNNKKRPITNYKLHCGCSGVRCLCSFLDRHVLPDTDALPCLSADREIRNDNLQVTVVCQLEIEKQTDQTKSQFLHLETLFIFMVFINNIK